MRPTLLSRITDRAVLPALPGFTRLGYATRSRRWSETLPQLDGRTIVVTGGTSGVGLAAAERLAALGASLVVVGRDAARTEDVLSGISARTGNTDLRAEVADLALMASVRDLGRRLVAREDAIHVLINNAGAMFPERVETPEGIERTLATNLLSHFLLTNLLIPRLVASTPARIVNVSSGGMYTQGVSLRNLQSNVGHYDAAKAYARTKRGQVIVTEMWADRLRSCGVVVNAMHPGWADTPGLANSMPAFHRFTRPWLRTPAEGADTIVWLAASPRAADVTGRFFLDRMPHVTNVLPGTDLAADGRAQLWEQLTALSGWDPGAAKV